MQYDQVDHHSKNMHFQKAHNIQYAQIAPDDKHLNVQKSLFSNA